MWTEGYCTPAALWWVHWRVGWSRLLWWCPYEGDTCIQIPKNSTMWRQDDRTEARQTSETARGHQKPVMNAFSLTTYRGIVPWSWTTTPVDELTQFVGVCYSMLGRLAQILAINKTKKPKNDELSQVQWTCVWSTLWMERSVNGTLCEWTLAHSFHMLFVSISINTADHIYLDILKGG